MMKLRAVAIAILASALAPGHAQTVIQTVQDLQNIQNNLSGSYVLRSNIDATATARWNAGAGFYPIGPFSGTFNGNGHTITGLFISSAGPNGGTNVGLFSSAGAGAVIENVNLVAANITSPVGGAETGGTGALVGYLPSNAQVINCTVTGTVTGTAAGNFVGGLVGWSNGGSITNSAANNITVSVPGNGTAGGGLVGLNTGLVSNSSATGSVTNASNGGGEGGLVGENESPGVIENSQASVNVSANSDPNGSATAAVGGLVGFNSATIRQSRATSGAISGTNGSLVGGLIGANYGTVQQSLATTSASNGYGGTGGGLVGYNVGTVQQCFATGPASSSPSGGDEGGLVGENVGVITQSYATGAVSGQSLSAIGGLVGYNGSSSPISQTYSIGAVQGPNASCAGGLVGCNASGKAASSGYWDTDTSFESSSATGTGETTAQFQSGTLPTGFDPTVWATNSGSFPHLIANPPPTTGYLNLKYQVLGVTYAPPGPSASTFVQYLNTSSVGSSQSLSQSFSKSNAFSVTRKADIQWVGVIKGSISDTFSTMATQTVKNTSSIATNIQVQGGEKTFGTANYFAPVNHDYDIIWIALNPVAVFTVYPGNQGSASVEWNGYGFDMADQPDIDVVGIPLGYLNGHFGPLPAQYKVAFARAWAASQTFPTGQGPAITSAELAQIASNDPFSVPTYGGEFLGNDPPPETSDHRFTLSACNGSSDFPYQQASPSAGAAIYTCSLTNTTTSTETQDITHSYQQTFSIDASFMIGSSGFFTSLTAELKDTFMLTWTTEQVNSTTSTTGSTASLSVQSPPCNNAVVGIGPCIPVYDADGNQPLQFAVFQDNIWHTFMFAPIGYSWPAVFDSLTVNRQGTGSGTVTSNDGAINCGTTCSANFSSGTAVTLTATPASGSVFSGWGGACSGTQACVVTMNAAQTVSATFAQTLLLTVSKAGTGSGTVASNDGAINCGTTCSANFNSGTTVTLTATPASGSAFAGWGGACSGTQACLVTMNATQAVSAKFGQILPGALSFIPVTPCRIADTRNSNGPFGGPFLGAGSTRGFTVPNSGCGIPAGAQAYSINVTVIPHGSLGFLTMFPCGQTLPLASTLNSTDGRVKAGAAIVPAGTGGAVCAFVSNDTDLIFDINGYFVSATNTSALAFYPVTPCRLVDTRLAAGPLGGPSLAGNAARKFPILSSSCNVPAAAQAYSLNYTSVPKGPLGFLTTWPTSLTQPLVSTLNAPTGAVTANAAIVSAGANGDVSVFVSNDSDLAIDINGYFAPPGAGGLSFFPLSPCRVLDSRTPTPTGGQPFTSLDLNITSAGCGAPATAQSFVLNATVVPPNPLGFLTLSPQGTPQPLVSTLNAGDGAVTSNMALVPTMNGSVSAFASHPTHLVLDILGYFASPAASPTVALSPTSAGVSSGRHAVVHRRR